MLNDLAERLGAHAPEPTAGLRSALREVQFWPVGVTGFNEAVGADEPALIAGERLHPVQALFGTSPAITEINIRSHPSYPFVQLINLSNEARFHLQTFSNIKYYAYAENCWLQPMPNGTMVSMRTELYNEQEELVLEHVSTFLQLGWQPEKSFGTRLQYEAPADLRKYRPRPTATHMFSRDDISKFAICSGDLQPIHLVDEVATLAGFTGVVAHGALVAARAISEATQVIADGDHTKVKAFRVAYSNPVYPETKIEFSVSKVCHGENGDKFVQVGASVDGQKAFRNAWIQFAP